MKTSFWIVISAALMVICSCSPKVTEPVVEAPPKPVKQQPRLESLTDCITFDDLDRSLRDRTEDAYVIYRDQIRFEKWDRAREIWKQAYYNAPGANGRVKYQYDDGIKIYELEKLLTPIIVIENTLMTPTSLWVLKKLWIKKEKRQTTLSSIHSPECSMIEYWTKK